MNLQTTVFRVAITTLATQPFLAAQGNQQVLLREDFNRPGINAAPDANKWLERNTYYPSTSRIRSCTDFEERNGVGILRARSHLVSRGQFDPYTIPGLTIRGRWRFAGTGGSQDFMQILTRSDGVPTRPFGETQNGLEFAIDPGSNQIDIRSRGPRITVGPPNMTMGNGLVLSTSGTYEFDIVDAGTTATITVRDVSPGAVSPARYLTVTVPVLASSATENRLVLHNREGCNDIVHVDWVEVVCNAYSTFGTSCPSSAGTIPSLTSPTGFHVGQMSTVQVTGLAPSTLGWMSYALDRTAVGVIPLPIALGPQAPGCSILVDLWSGQLPVTFSTLGGTVTSNLPIPMNHNLAGLTIYNQLISLDAAANRLGIVTTNAGMGTIGH